MPDQVFVGEDLERAVEPSGFVLREIGVFDLKGVAKPITIYEASDVVVD